MASYDNDKTYDIKKVKFTDEEFIEITVIKPGIDERNVTRELTTEYENVTPFFCFDIHKFQGTSHALY